MKKSDRETKRQKHRQNINQKDRGRETRGPRKNRRRVREQRYRQTMNKRKRETERQRRYTQEERE